MAKRSFILNNQSKKNSHGFYLLNDGGDFLRFGENPVMLYDHRTGDCIGKWENLRIENSVLLADPVFDQEDPEAAKIAGKVERGFLKGCSPGIGIIEAECRVNFETEKEEVYVTKWELYEASVCSLPSNAGALSLMVYDQNRQPLSEDKLPEYLNSIVKLSLHKTNQLKTNQKEMEKIMLLSVALVALGLQDSADGKAISDAIVSLKADRDAIAKELSDLKTKLETEKESQINAAINLALSEGRIQADEKDDFIALAKTNFEACKRTLDKLPKKQSLSGVVSPIGSSNISPERKTWNLSMWMKNDMQGLKRLQAESPEEYQLIVSKK